MGKSLKGQELGKGISQRPDGLFVARKMVDGKTISVSNKSLTELRKQFKEAIEKEKNAYSGRMTYQEWYEVWFKEIKEPRMKCDLSAMRFSKAYERTFPKYIGKIRMDNIQPIHIQTAVNNMTSDGYGYNSVDIALMTTKQVFKHAVSNGVILANPCVNIEVNRSYKKRLPKYEIEDWVLKLFMSTIHNFFGEEAFKFMLFSGVRIGELAALRWSDIDFEKKTIHINRSVVVFYAEGHLRYRFVSPKSEKGIRTIPFIGGMEQLLIEWKPKRQKIHDSYIKRGVGTYTEEYHDLVFVSQGTGHPYYKNNARLAIRRNVERMKAAESEMAASEGREPREIPPIRTHLFRHAFATKCFESGMYPRTVQDLMGHTSYATTSHYTHITESFMDDEVDKANKVFCEF